MKLSIKLSIIFFIFFAFIGVVTIATALHEYSHFNDYKKIAKNDYICGLVLPKSISDIQFDFPSGYYSMSYDRKDKEVYESISKYTEYKGYFITVLIISSFLLSWAIIIYHYRTLLLKNGHETTIKA